MNAGHTPAPWSYRPEPHDDWGVVRAGIFWICQAKDPAAVDDATLAAHRAAKTDPWEANARLIAAAPELLDALKAMVAQSLHFPGFNTFDRVFAERAIAKATTP